MTKYRKSYTIESNKEGCDFMAQVNIRMDDGIKAEAEQLFSQLGLNFSTAVNMFVLQAIREGGIPFAITTKTGQSDAELLAQSIREEQEGKVITKTMEELRAMEE